MAVAENASLQASDITGPGGCDVERLSGGHHCLPQFVAATAISLLLSFVSFTLLSVMDESMTATPQNTGSGGSSSVVSAGTFLIPVAKFLARSRFVRAALVAFTQPSLLSVAGIACCLMLVYLRDALVRVGADVTVLLEHFAIFQTSTYGQK